MCAPISTTVSSVTSSSFATAMLTNQILAITTILSVIGYKLAKILKLA